MCIRDRARTKYLSTEVAGGFTGVLLAMYVIDPQNRIAELLLRQYQWHPPSEVSTVPGIRFHPGLVQNHNAGWNRMPGTVETSAGGCH